MFRRAGTGAMLVCGLVLLSAGGYPPSGVGTYGNKQKGSDHTFRYYSYYSTTAKKTKYHKAIYYPSLKRYIYLFNPESGLFWGRYDLTRGGYQLLDNRFKSNSLNKIPEKAFGPPGKMPPPEKGYPGRMLPPPEAR